MWWRRSRENAALYAHGLCRGRSALINPPQVNPIVRQSILSITRSPISALPMLIFKAIQDDEEEANSPKNPGRAADFQLEPVLANEANQ